jgi:hypothetical protein
MDKELKKELIHYLSLETRKFLKPKAEELTKKLENE